MPENAKPPQVRVRPLDDVHRPFGNGAGDSDVEAEKGAISDAFKRAAVKWGIGRYLYDLDSPWVDLVPAGKGFKISPEGMAKLRASLSAADPEARAIIWSQANAKAIRAAFNYPAAASIFAEAGVQLKEKAQ
jgi:hypothetical protein